jgi:hypothetical protein
MQKNRIAICMYGFVSSTEGKRDVQGWERKGKIWVDFNNKNYVDINLCRQSIEENIIDPNSKSYEFDFYIHSWSYDLESNLNTLYKPRDSFFEENTYMEFLKNEYPDDRDHNQRSASLSMHKSIMMCKKREIKKDFKYNKIIIYRPDLIMSKKINLNDYNTDELIYCNGQGYIKVEDGGDLMFLMSSENADKFKDITFYKKIRARPHEWYNKYIKKIMKKDLIPMQECSTGEHIYNLRGACSPDHYIHEIYPNVWPEMVEKYREIVYG